MGDYISRLAIQNQQNIEQKRKSDVDVQVSEVDNIHTPQIFQKKSVLANDPRSVTAGIQRTPIQVNATPLRADKKISAIPRYLQSKQYLETDVDAVLPPWIQKNPPRSLICSAQTEQTPLKEKNHVPCLTANNNCESAFKKEDLKERERFGILGIDPRSPTVNFDRTPILIFKSTTRLKAQSQEDLGSCVNYNDVETRYSYCETMSSLNIPEIQAVWDNETDTIKALNVINDSSKDTTNEPNASRWDDESFNIGSVNEMVENNTMENNCTATASKEDKSILDELALPIRRDHINSPLDFVEDKIKKAQVKSNNVDEIRVWRDSVSLKVSQNCETTNTDYPETHKETIRTTRDDVIIAFDDELIIKDTLSSKMIKTSSDRQKKVGAVTGKKSKIQRTGCKPSLPDKKIFNAEKHVQDSAKARTPLGNRSNNGQISTMIPNISPQQLLRNKSMGSKIFQENTPPHRRNMVKSKPNGGQWDPNSTVII